MRPVVSSRLFALIWGAFAVVGAPVLTAVADPAPAPAPAAPAPKVDTMAAAHHAKLTKLLKTYIVEGEDGVNRVNYGAWHASETDRAALAAYVAAFADWDMDALSHGEAIAAWSNLYNAVTLEHILDRYPVKSIRSGYIIGPWKRVKTQAGGLDVSLHEIEHDILREMDEPRIHYSINCASYSCPNLLAKAFTAKTLEADLDAAARAYVNNARGVTVTDRGLVVSEIYKWFEDDFGGSKAGVIEHLKAHAEPELLAAIKANPRIRKYDYDWDLNDVE